MKQKKWTGSLSTCPTFSFRLKPLFLTGTCSKASPFNFATRIRKGCSQISWDPKFAWILSKQWAILFASAFEQRFMLSRKIYMRFGLWSQLDSGQPNEEALFFNYLIKEKQEEAKKKFPTLFSSRYIFFKHFKRKIGIKSMSRLGPLPPPLPQGSPSNDLLDKLEVRKKYLAKRNEFLRYIFFFSILKFREQNLERKTHPWVRKQI